MLNGQCPLLNIDSGLLNIEHFNFKKCGWRDSNPHAVKHQILSLACLPISPHPQTVLAGIYASSFAASFQRQTFCWAAKVKVNAVGKGKKQKNFYTKRNFIELLARYKNGKKRDMGLGSVTIK